MRVLLLATDAYGGRGGIALCNRNLVRALLEIRFVKEIVVIPRCISDQECKVPDKVRFIRGAAGGKFRYVLNSLSASFGQFDLIICGHINLLPLAATINRYARARLALVVHGIDVWQKPYSHAKYWLNSVDLIWSVSALTRNRMNSWAEQPEEKYAILPNTIHLEQYGISDRRLDLVSRYALGDCKTIMTLARLSSSERYKGIDEVIELMPSLLVSRPKLKYLVVGDGDDRPRLERKVQDLGLSGQVIFTGSVHESEKADYYRLADAFVMPSNGEGFGIVYLEALACGVPAVGSLTDGSREALRDGMLGELVNPADPDSIRQGVLNALGKPRQIPNGLEYFAWPAFSARVSHSVRLLTRQST
ncbi:MAG: glycosyltransferase family 4 protein [Pseudomonadales bacterium]|nr:glycosyltransferase family 4 protein [Pseudomonadales bacterium]MCP5188059.1 glycosyltransferase family 4 protein [Pseudomonadales bacterium]